MNLLPAWLGRNVLAGAVGLLAVGCGGGGGGGYSTYEGTLEVANDDFSTDVLEGIDIDEIGGPDYFQYDVVVFPGEAIDFGLYPAAYDVTLYWGDGFVDFFTVDVYDGSLTILTVSN